MSAPNVFPFRDSHGEEQPHYLPPHILSAVKREAAADGVSDWAGYAQAKLDRELRACSLLLTDEQVAMLHRYAEVLGVQPQDLLAALLAPEAARRERIWRRITTFTAEHLPRRPHGCLALAFWPSTVVGLYAIAHWAMELLPLLIRR